MVEREGMRQREKERGGGERVGWLMGGETSVVRSCVLSVFSVSLDIPSTKQQSPRPPPATLRGRTRSPSRASATLPRPVSPPCIPPCHVYLQRHTHAQTLSLSPAHACVYTRDRRIISKTKRVSFPRSGRGSEKVEEPQS